MHMVLLVAVIRKERDNRNWAERTFQRLNSSCGEVNGAESGCIKWTTEALIT